MPRRFRDILVLGFALFAMFLGAANIIFPPYLGALTGQSWGLAYLGFLFTGVGLPVLGVAAIAKVGGSADALASQVSPTFSLLLNSIIFLFIGPLFAIPRTAATTVELSVRPFLPASWSPRLILVVASFLFLALCYLFVRSPGKTVDRIGTLLTPVLVSFLLVLIALSVIRPIGTPVPSLEARPFYTGFVTGYQTMDALGAIIFGGTMVASLRAKGYTADEVKRLIWPIALLAGVAILVVYGGFTWIGASASAHFVQGGEKTVFTVLTTTLLAGPIGKILLALIIFFACSSTAIGLTVTVTQFFLPFFKGKLSERGLAILVLGLSYILSILGVEGIIQLATPLLELAYPVAIVLIVLGLLSNHLHYRYAYWGALLACIPVAILNLLRLYLDTRPLADAWLIHFPFGDAGFGCYIPALLGALIGDWWAKTRELAGTLPPSVRLHLDYPRK